MASPDPTLGPSTPALDSALGWAGGLFAQLVSSRKRLVAYLLSGAVLGTALAFLLPSQYTSKASFITQATPAQNLQGMLQGAVASLGLLDRANDYSPKFYADLLTSRPILLSAIQHPYEVPTSNGSRLETYLEIEGFDDDPPARALERALEHLAKRVSASADARTNLITLSVRARYQRLSRDLARQLLTALDSLNVGFRQSQSRGSREFYATRVAQARAELDSAEGVVRRFLLENRVINSPALDLEGQRLRREAEMKRTLYSTMMQQYEQARLQEARNVPTITVLAEPFVPVKRSFPLRRLFVALGALLGVVVLWAQIRIGQAVRRFREAEPENWEMLERQIRGVRRLVRRS